MAEVFVGSLMLVPYNFAPKGFAFCQGQILAISQNTALFSLLGTTYGGNGTSTFALPDLRGRTPISQGQGPGLSQYDLGEVTGQEFETLSTSEMPAHSHTAGAQGPPLASGLTANGNVVGSGKSIYVSGSAPNATLSPQFAVGQAGGSQPHENRMPFLTMNWIIALQGIFPSRN